MVGKKAPGHAKYVGTLSARLGLTNYLVKALPVLLSKLKSPQPMRRLPGLGVISGRTLFFAGAIYIGLIQSLAGPIQASVPPTFSMGAGNCSVFQS